MPQSYGGPAPSCVNTEEGVLELIGFSPWGQGFKVPRLKTFSNPGPEMEMFIQEIWKIFRDLHPRQDSDQLSGPEHHVSLRFYKGLGRIGFNSDYPNIIDCTNVH